MGSDSISNQGNREKSEKKIQPNLSKSWMQLFDTLGCNFFFFLLFPLFPSLDVKSLPPAFYLFYIVFVTPLHIFFIHLLVPLLNS